MALNSFTQYSNSIVGVPSAGTDVNVMEANSTPKYPAGYMIERADGNRFRYCHVGTATNSGVLVGPTTSSGGATYNAAAVVASASAVPVQEEYPILPGQIGSHFIEVTISSIAANKYQGGYFVTTRGTGIGETYRIAGNTATGNPASGNLRIRLYEPIRVAITANMGNIIVPSMFTDLTITATTSPQVTGVLMATTTSTNQWAWVCTRGVVGCQEDGTNTPVAGAQIVSSRVTAGAYASMVTVPTTVSSSVFSSPIIGYIVTIASAGSAGNRQGVIYLEIE